ncbi:hypothetical protein OIV83_004569 [Microbotryomycetes sp. JL201]|nr:hypothetical protein OIV83_004569 [Microbotryomycetes sp. JL201]
MQLNMARATEKQPPLYTELLIKFAKQSQPGRLSVLAGEAFLPSTFPLTILRRNTNSNEDPLHAFPPSAKRGWHRAEQISPQTPPKTFAGPSSTDTSAVASSGSSRKRRASDSMPSTGSRSSGGRGKNGKSRAGSVASRATSNSSKRARLAKDKGPSEIGGPAHDLAWVISQWSSYGLKGNPDKITSNPKSLLANYVMALTGTKPVYDSKPVSIDGKKMTRVTVVADPNPPPPMQAFGGPSLPQMAEPIIGTGDGSAKEAEKIAAIHAMFQLHARKLVNSSNLPTRAPEKLPTQAMGDDDTGDVPALQGKRATLSKGDQINLEEAKIFIDFYCKKFDFGKPEFKYSNAADRGRRKGGGGGTWEATLSIAGSALGVGHAKAKKDAANTAHLDAVRHIEFHSPDLWQEYLDRKQNNLIAKGKAPPHVAFQIDGHTNAQLSLTLYEAESSTLYKEAQDMMAQIEREKAQKREEQDPEEFTYPKPKPTNGGGFASGGYTDLENRSQQLMERLKNYEIDDRLKKMRRQRESLPVTSNAASLLAKINTNAVTVVLAATGSGKTTQIPQLILDDWIMRGEGANCNIICTQPRRIAAVSVAERVAKERGESLGESIGYQVRFESKPPEPNGSVLFCTTGLFLRRMQTDLNKTASEEGFLDSCTHVCVDEVHERDVDTDLLLFVLRMLLHKRRKEGKRELKVVLMSATIDPTLFTQYFADPDTGRLAPTIEVPGRAFPVQQHYLGEIVEELHSLRLGHREGAWVFQDENVYKYLQRENQRTIAIDDRTGRYVGEVDDLKMPYPLLALVIANVIAKSDEGHVLVFLPGWDEIKAVDEILQDSRRYPLLGINFASPRYEVHKLHSTVPLAEQQAVFEPPPAGVRRVVLSTNIAETSVTIPDVVYVVDTAKCKEKRYDPELRLSQLVSAWTGTSNIRQRAGRAGRHRPGEYYGIVSKARYDTLAVHQTVEMLRTDLAQTSMHIIGLELPGLRVEDVLAETIQPPERARIKAAMHTLSMVGAIDRDEKLTSLGRVLLQIPVEVAVGKLCLLGSFFRCLDSTLTLAAILTNRDPFLSPMDKKVEADKAKSRFTPIDFRSDTFAVLNAYNEWWKLQSQGNYNAANSFASVNFLSKPTLLLIAKVREHILQSLDKAGVLSISGGRDAISARPGSTFRRNREATVPESLNVNGDSLPLLSALVATALAPNFAIRVSEKSLKTQQDKSCSIHPSSVNSRRNEKAADLPISSSKQLYAFVEKSKSGGLDKGGQIFLRSTTMLDPLGYMLFGATTLRRMINGGIEADSWLPLVGNDFVLDDIENLKQNLDLCMLRVFEGLEVAGSRRRYDISSRMQPRDEYDSEADEDLPFERKAVVLSSQEVHDLDILTSNVVRLLNLYAEARGAGSTVSSRQISRAPSPHGGGRFSARTPSSMPTTRAVTLLNGTRQSDSMLNYGPPDPSSRAAHSFAVKGAAASSAKQSSSRDSW